MTCLLTRDPAARHARRTARLQERHLRAELAAFRTEAERNELHEMLDRYPDDVAEPVRQLIR